MYNNSFDSKTNYTNINILTAHNKRYFIDTIKLKIK